VAAPVAINARAAVRTEVSGVERWAREMVDRLPALRPGAYEVFEPPAALAHRPGQLWEQGVLPLRAARRRARVLFSPANLAPVAWPRNVVVLHDAVALSHPEWFSPLYRTWHGLIVRAVARTALKVIVPSRFSGDELVALAGLAPDRVEVVPGGVDERFRPDVDPGPAREALGLERPYVLTVGGLGTRKNVRALVPVAHALDGVEVVAAGVRRTHHSHEEDLPGIRGLGYVPEELLPSLYAGARAFVLPSLHEGFGLTCIEAMRAGVPVAASDRGALPEACAGAALHFDPDDEQATIAAVRAVVEDEAERARLREAGLAPPLR
jgi:glycosyltransferase involved in cell wall biosynthesis